MGGFVRDLLLPYPCSREYDLDIVVEGNGLLFAQALARSLNAELRQHPRFQTSTLTSKDGFTIDVATARQEHYPGPGVLPVVQAGNLKQDLFRRDFSINAMAMRLTQESFGELIDDYGGRADLQAGRVKILHDRSFVDDPTRVFRAVRFEQRLGFHLEPNTEELLGRAVAHGFDRLSSERLRNEILACLREETPLDNLHRLQGLRVLQSVHPALALEQRTNSLLAELPEALTCLGGILCGTASKERAYLRVWFHHLDPTQRLHLQERLRLPRERPEPAQHLDQTIQELTDPSLPDSRLYRLLHPYQPEELALLVCLARCADIDGELVRNRLTRFVTELRPLRPMIDGRHLCEAGLKPGPRFKEILEAARDTQIDQRWESPDQALDWLNASPFPQ